MRSSALSLTQQVLTTITSAFNKYADNNAEELYAILNYGCQMNESDSEHYAGQLEELGYKRTEDLFRADVIVVNTCCVRESAELRILGKIGELKNVKAHHPGQIICVAGCMAQKDGAALVKKYPQIDLLLGTSYVNSFKKILQDYLDERRKGVYTKLEVQSSRSIWGYFLTKAAPSFWAMHPATQMICPG